jgi:plastocyanin
VPRLHVAGLGAPAVPAAVGLLAAASLTVPASGQASAPAPRPGGGTGQTVRVVAGRPLEFAFSLSTDRVHTGAVTFLVVNAGRIPHDFWIRGHGTPSIPPGGRARITVGFAEPGVYEYADTILGHAMAGMEGNLTVTELPRPSPT